MEREVKAFTTPSGKPFEIKTYLTARERNDLRAIYLENVTVNAQTAQSTLADLTGPVLEKVEKKILELVIASYDGTADNILDRLLDGSPEDYDFIVAEAGKVANLTPAR